MAADAQHSLVIQTTKRTDSMKPIIAMFATFDAFFLVESIQRAFEKKDQKQIFERLLRNIHLNMKLYLSQRKTES